MTDTYIENEIDNIIEATTQEIDNSEMATYQNDTYQNDIQNNDIHQQQIPDTSTSMNEADIEVFNTALHQYLRVNEEIKTLMNAIKTRNEIKKNLGETLSSFLKTNQIKNVNLDGSYKGKRLETVVSTTASGFNRATVTEAIYNELKEDQEIFDKIMQALSRTSVMKEVWKLKIVEEKQASKGKGAGSGTGKGKKKPNILDEVSDLLDN
jgi:hypothetical protein